MADMLDVEALKKRLRNWRNDPANNIVPATLQADVWILILDTLVEIKQYLQQKL